MTHVFAKVRHLPWIVCLVILMAACSGGGSSSSAPDPEGTNISTGAQGPDEEEGDTGEDGSDPDADLPGADRGPQIPEDAFLQQRLSQHGVPSIKAFDAAAAQAALIRAQTARLAPALAKKGWKFLGPRVVGGRVVDAAVDPQHKDGVYVASSGAGLWYSADAGQTFTSVWPTSVTHTMGAVAVASDGTVYAGTGETNPGGGSITYGGDGIYKSTDGGKTWDHVGLTSSGTIGRIMVDPKDPKRIWVAASGNLFVPGGQRGVYESTDAGKSWKLSFAPPNKTTGAVDITIDPTSSDHVVASLWDHQRKPDVRRYTGIGSGIWETTDGGKSWQRLGTDQGLPAPSKDTGRIGVSFAPSDGKRIYAIYANNSSGAFQNFFTSTNGGKSWSQAAGASNLGGSQSTYGWWFARIFVDPANADDLFVPGVSMYRSTNGADSFTACCGSLHADQHIVVWDTHQGGDMYAGNDGGFYASTNNGTSFTKSDNEP